MKLKIGIISQQEFFFLSIQKGWTEVQQPMVVASDRNAEPKVKMKNYFNRLIHPQKFSVLDMTRAENNCEL